MPIAYIYPDSTESNTNWTVDASTTLHATLTTTAENLPTPSDVDDIIAAADGANFVVTLEDVHFGNLNISQVNSIQVEGKHYNVAKSNVSNYTVRIKDSSDTSLYVETSSNVTPTDTYSDWNLTPRTTSDGSTAWGADDINGLKLDVTGNVDSGEMRLNWIRIMINYDENAPIYESGEPNMNVEEGIITVDEGIVIL